MLRTLVGLALVLSLLVGCERSAPPPDAKTSPTPSAASGPSSGSINLVTGDAKSLDALIAAHKGKVVFVDCWATWCGPCVESFPHTVRLAKKHRDQGLATIAVSFDNLADEAKVRDFLAKQGADFENLLSKYDGINQEAAVDFDVEALPQYRLYDRQGKLKHKWEGPSGEIEKQIETLLAEQP